MKLIYKTCPNCGANLKFNVNDESVTCDYCGTFVLIEHEKQKMNKPIELKNAQRIYVNKISEILKWVSRGIISSMLIILGLAFCAISIPISGIIMFIAGILAIIPPTFKIFARMVYVKIALIAVLAMFGFFAGVFCAYDLPNEFQGKYVSDTTNLTVEIKGNTIIINDNGEITKEKIYTWEETYGHFTYHNIKVNNGEYNFRIVNHGDVDYKFYLRNGQHGGPVHYFYNTKKETDKYVCHE